MADMKPTVSQFESLPLVSAEAPGNSTLNELGGHAAEMTSGSGSGQTKLSQRTLAKMIVLSPPPGGLLGKGRYGQVWLGSLHGEKVAVKLFDTPQEGAFQREDYVYNLPGMRHASILICRGSDVASLNGATKFWLVTDYHPKGSLFDHLNTYLAICPRDALRLLASAIRGVAYLHKELRHGNKVRDTGFLVHHVSTYNF